MKKVTTLAVCGLICSMGVTTVFSEEIQTKKYSDREIAEKSYGARQKKFEQLMDTYIKNEMNASGAVGLSMVVVENDRIVYEKGFGYADKEQEIPVESSTLFHIGSITKLFTGIGIMQLAQKGLVDIDAPIQQYLPEFSIKYHMPARQTVTIRSIMAHQSGIFGDKFSLVDGSVYPPEDFRMYPEFARHEYAPYRPNYTTAYSNFAVSLLGLIIERVSGEKYEAYVFEHILKPCGMLESGFDPKNEQPSLLAKGYDGQGNPVPYYYIDANPAGFLASNSDDMARFIKMILHKGFYDKKWILYPGTLNSMYHHQNFLLPMNLFDDYSSMYTFGLSWMLENRSYDYLGKVVGHGGNLPPYNSSLLIAKDKNIGIFVTTNSGELYPNGISYYALEQAAKIFRNIDKPDLPEVPPVITMPRHLKKIYSGSYCMLYENPLEVYEENDTMFAHMLHAERIPLVYHADDWVSLYVNGTVIPGIRFSVRYRDGKKILFSEDRNLYLIRREIAGNAFNPDETLPAFLERFTGTYKECTTEMPLIQVYPDQLSRSDKPFLKADILLDNSVYCFLPALDSSLIIQGMGRGAQETIYTTGDTLNYAGLKFVKITAIESARKTALAETTTGSSTTMAKTQPLKTSDEVISELKRCMQKRQQF